MATIGIVLAGGESKRMGRLKQLLTYRGKPLIRHVIDALSDVVDRVIVSVSSRVEDAIRSVVPSWVEIVVDDESFGCKGPVLGVVSVVSRFRAEEYLMLPCDLPWIKPTSLRGLVEAARSVGASVASPYWANGSISTLTSYFTHDIAEKLIYSCRVRREYTRPSDIHRSSNRLLLLPPRSIGATPLEFTSVNKPDDLESPKPPSEGWATILSSTHSLHYSRAVLRRSIGDHLGAAMEHLREAGIYAKLGLTHLHVQALVDACREASEAGASWLVSKLRNAVSMVRLRLGWRHRHGRDVCL